MSTRAPSARQKSASASTAAGSASGSGVSRVQRLSKSCANPAPGPECSVPASGCAGTKCTPAGTCGATASITARLTEPTSLSVAPGASRGPISAATSAIAPTGTARTTRSAPSTASPALSKTSASPSRAASARVSAVRA